MHWYQFLLTDASTNTLVSKTSDTDADTDTLVFTDYFLFGIGTYCMYTDHYSVIELTARLFKNIT